MASPQKRSIAAQLEGALLVSRDAFPYLMLVALEAGGPLRAMLLLLVSPILRLLRFLRLEEASLRVMIFVSTAGLGVAEVKAVSRATLPKFFLDELRESACRLLSRCGGRRYVMTGLPRIVVEPFLRDYLEVEQVIGTELMVLGGRYLTGLVARPGVMGGALGLEALRLSLAGSDVEIDVGLGDGLRDHPFMLLCKEPHLIAPDEKPLGAAAAGGDCHKPLIFHDGRLAVRPTPVNCLATALWVPMGVVLSISRVLVGVALPHKLGPMGCAATGLRIRAQGCRQQEKGRGTLYVCCHRTLLDPVFTSVVLQRRVSAVTYSLSRLSEVISPIPTVRLARDRDRDAAAMRRMLRDHGDVVVCPEGTTCREPYLLRFSPLFAEIADGAIVPVAVTAQGSMFYGTTVRGYKCLDSLFFLMNPTPCYQLQFLHPIRTTAEDGGGRRDKYEVANQVQESIGRVLGFKCTNLTRKDKYRALAGNDGLSPI